MVLLSVVFGSIALLLVFQDELVYPLLIGGWIVHLVAAAYCHKLWVGRKLCWMALGKWCAIMDDITASIAGPGSLLPAPEDRLAEMRQPLPILS